MDRLLPVITLLRSPRCLFGLPLTFLVKDNVDIMVIIVISYTIFFLELSPGTTQLHHHINARLKNSLSWRCISQAAK